MKLIFWLLLLPLSLVAQPSLNKNVVKNKALKFSAEVKQVEINKGESLEYLKNYDALTITLKVKLTNTGDTPILLLKERLDYAGIEIAQNIDEFETNKGEFSAYNLQTSANFVDDKMWNLNKKALDTKKPDSKKISVLLPNEIIEYDENIRLNLPKNENDRYKFSPWKTHSLAELKKLPSIFIKLQKPTLLSYGISKKERNRLNLAEELQKRWSKYGYLWLDDIQSVPIVLDLKTGDIR